MSQTRAINLLLALLGFKKDKLISNRLGSIGISIGIGCIFYILAWNLLINYVITNNSAVMR